VVGLADANSAEHGVASENIVVAPVSCPVLNRKEGAPKLSGHDTIRLKPGSRGFEIYGQKEISEEYFCNYELNPAYRPRLEAAGLEFTGFGSQGEARVAELPGHRFYFVTLFQPPLSSTPDKPHPVVGSYLEAAGRFQQERASAGIAGAAS
jgi:CTP synthase (UTP-ammonia lyase)